MIRTANRYWIALLPLLASCLIHDPATIAARARLDAFPAPPSTARQFSDHRRDVAQWIDAQPLPGRSASDRALNLPFDQPATPAGTPRGTFLLLHGLNDSPGVWRDVSRALGRRGFARRGVLFAGHGSSPRDMLHVRMERWLDDARLHLDALLAEGGPVYIGGFSLGAVVATHLALDRPTVAGLLLMSPAFDSRLNHLLRWSGLYAHFQPWVFGTTLLEDNPIKYNSIAVNSGWQYFRLTRALKRRWGFTGRVRAPTLMVHSENDSVVDVSYTRRLFDRRFVNPRSELLSYAPLTSGTTIDEPVCKRCTQRQGAWPEQRVLSQSHLGLMNASDHPLFGAAGKVLVCNGNDYPVFMACMRSKQHWFGAQHAVSPDGVPVARSTWNPDWEGFLARFDAVFPPARR